MSKRRRERGEGSIYQRKDGRYVGQYEVEGKRYYVYDQDKAKVREKLTKALADRDAGLICDSQNLTLSEYISVWLDSIRETISLRTWIRYEEITRIHINPMLGKVHLNKLNPLQVQSFYRKKLDGKTSSTTVRKIHLALHKALKQAVRWQLIPRNVCEAVTAPREQRTEIVALTEQEVKRLLEVAVDDQLYALYILACTTGMRQGELLALRWECVDFNAGTVQVKFTTWKGTLYPPKTPRSRRTVRLSRMALRALWDHRQQQSPEAVWCFPNRAGQPRDCHNFIYREWKRMVQKAGLSSKTRFHDLRHTCATLLLTKGVHPKIVQELLGHSSISITLDTYSHVLPNMQEKVVEAMEDIFEDEEH